MISASFINHTLTQPVARVAEIAAAKEKAAKDKAKRREKQKKYRERVCRARAAQEREGRRLLAPGNGIKGKDRSTAWHQ